MSNKVYVVMNIVNYEVSNGKDLWVKLNIFFIR